MSETRETPNPGTKEAIEAGCTCPVIDNYRGRGFWGEMGVFMYSASCPVHAPEDCPARGDGNG